MIIFSKNLGGYGPFGPLATPMLACTGNLKGKKEHSNVFQRIRFAPNIKPLYK